MAVMKFQAKVSEDGMIHVPVPGLLPGSNVEVEVQSQSTLEEPLDELGWPIGFHDRMFGCITDEAFVAPVRSMPRPVPPLDAE